MGIIGQSVTRVDAPDKVTGRAKYTDDIADKSALIAKVLHSTIAHGYVKSIDTSEAERIKGVVKIVTCFDVPDIPFPTTGHPWSIRTLRTGCCSTAMCATTGTMWPRWSHGTR